MSWQHAPENFLTEKRTRAALRPDDKNRNPHGRQQLPGKICQALYNAIPTDYSLQPLFNLKAGKRQRCVDIYCAPQTPQIGRQHPVGGKARRRGGSSGIRQAGRLPHNSPSHFTGAPKIRPGIRAGHAPINAVFSPRLFIRRLTVADLAFTLLLQECVTGGAGWVPLRTIKLVEEFRI